MNLNLIVLLLLVYGLELESKVISLKTDASSARVVRSAVSWLWLAAKKFDRIDEKINNDNP